MKSVPYAPVSHPFVERLIGTIRREYLGRVFFWNAVDLSRKHPMTHQEARRTVITSRSGNLPVEVP